MYQHAYGVIPGCSPHAFAPCQRRILDNFATPAECSDLIDATEMAMENLFHQGCALRVMYTRCLSAARNGRSARRGHAYRRWTKGRAPPAGLGA